MDKVEVIREIERLAASINMVAYLRPVESVEEEEQNELEIEPGVVTEEGAVEYLKKRSSGKQWRW